MPNFTSIGKDWVWETPKLKILSNLQSHPTGATRFTNQHVNDKDTGYWIFQIILICPICCFCPVRETNCADKIEILHEKAHHRFTVACHISRPSVKMGWCGTVGIPKISTLGQIYIYCPYRMTPHTDQGEV